mmetsp:Transcript_104076/g.333671  ORF Transcript_104076/g.333671 Transcript_104076/m.333671 type:complete len:345 (+) Transcript_104076:2513-3547(+)
MREALVRQAAVVGKVQGLQTPPAGQLLPATRLSADRLQAHELLPQRVAVHEVRGQVPEDPPRRLQCLANGRQRLPTDARVALCRGAAAGDAGRMPDCGEVVADGPVDVGQGPPHGVALALHARESLHELCATALRGLQLVGHTLQLSGLEGRRHTSAHRRPAGRARGGAGRALGDTAQLPAQSLVLILQSRKLRHLRVVVDDRCVLDVPGTVRVLQGGQSLLEVTVCTARAREHESPGVAPQTVLQQPRELGLSIRHVAAPLGGVSQRRDDVAQGKKARVDGNALLESAAHRAGAFCALGSSQVHKVELRGPVRRRRLGVVHSTIPNKRSSPYPLLQNQSENGV